MSEGAQRCIGSCSLHISNNATQNRLELRIAQFVLPVSPVMPLYQEGLFFSVCSSAALLELPQVFGRRARDAKEPGSRSAGGSKLFATAAS